MKKKTLIYIGIGILVFVVVVIISKNISQAIESNEDKSIVKEINVQRARIGEQQIPTNRT